MALQTVNALGPREIIVINFMNMQRASKELQWPSTHQIRKHITTFMFRFVIYIHYMFRVQRLSSDGTHGYVQPSLWCIYLSIYLAVYLSICLSIYLPIYLSSWLSIYTSIYPSMYLFIYLSIYPYICLNIYALLFLPLGAQGIPETLRFTSVSSI
jgi:hypothetical protein